MVCIQNAKVVLESGILFDGVILLDGDRIIDIGNRKNINIPEGAEMVDANGAYVGPGFVDIHVHGGETYMFHSHPEQAAKHFLSHGETTQLATLYYDLSKEEFLASIYRVKAAMRDTEAGQAIAGFYMEGPYMNAKYGASPEKNKWKGTILEEDYAPLVEAAGELAKVWAVAPEREGVSEFMAYVHKEFPDAAFAVGHSEATPEQIQKVKRFGVRLQTHCMDATGHTSKWAGTRGCGPDEACMLDSEMYAELICDSMAVHVNPQLQNLILKTKGLDKVILISDSFVSFEDSPEGLRDVSDLAFDANGNLSGSRLTLDAACRNLMRHTNCGIAQAFLLAARNPAKVIGMDHEIGSIQKGKKANLVFVDDMFNVKTVILNGKEIKLC